MRWCSLGLGLAIVASLAVPALLLTAAGIHATQSSQYKKRLSRTCPECKVVSFSLATGFVGGVYVRMIQAEDECISFKLVKEDGERVFPRTVFECVQGTQGCNAHALEQRRDKMQAPPPHACSVHSIKYEALYSDSFLIATLAILFGQLSILLPIYVIAKIFRWCSAHQARLRRLTHSRFCHLLFMVTHPKQRSCPLKSFAQDSCFDPHLFNLIADYCAQDSTTSIV